jgi:hypothetical protein
MRVAHRLQGKADALQFHPLVGMGLYPEFLDLPSWCIHRRFLHVYAQLRG